MRKLLLVLTVGGLAAGLVAGCSDSPGASSQPRQRSTETDEAMRKAMRYPGNDEKSQEEDFLPAAVVAALKDQEGRSEAAPPPGEPAPEPSTPLDEPGTPAPEPGTPSAPPEGAGDTPADDGAEEAVGEAIGEAVTKAFEEMMKDPPPEMIAAAKEKFAEPGFPAEFKKDVEDDEKRSQMLMTFKSDKMRKTFKEAMDAKADLKAAVDEAAAKYPELKEALGL
jgi:hypothetical protein